MPATSQAQRTAIAIAEHSPSKLYSRNKGMLGMSHGQMHDFAATPARGLPKYHDNASVGAKPPASSGSSPGLGTTHMVGAKFKPPHMSMMAI
jgi:hypothetical protein